MTMSKFLVLVVLPILVMASLLEAVVLASRQAYDWKALGVSLTSLVTRHIFSVVIPFSLAAPVFGWAWEHRLGTVAINSWQTVATLFLGQEFCYYWYHRASHRMRWFWANHSVHHTPNQLTLAAAYRISIVGKLTGSVIFFVPLVWVGFHPQLVLTILTLNLAYQFWIHATWIPKLGWLEYVLNTPSSHRVHHASNPAYLDSNYGGVLIVFDRLFGTYVAERTDTPCQYGLVQPQTSYNPLRVEFGEWLSLVKDVVAARGLNAKLAHLVMPPGWSAAGASETTEALRQRIGK